jgi:hypothetical protein
MTSISVEILDSLDMYQWKEQKTMLGSPQAEPRAPPRSNYRIPPPCLYLRPTLPRPGILYGGEGVSVPPTLCRRTPATNSETSGGRFGPRVDAHLEMNHTMPVIYRLRFNRFGVTHSASYWD